MEDTEQDIEGAELKETTELPSLKLRVRKCLDDMRNGGINYGSFYPNAFFEERLFMKRSDECFSLQVSEIRKDLMQDGYFLTCRGQKKWGYTILPANRNVDVTKSLSKQAARALTRGVILGTNTRTDSLTLREQERHEKALRNIVVQHLSMERSKGVEKMIRNRFPQIELEQAP